MRLVGLVAVGTAALRHVGASTPALSAKRGNRGLDEVHRTQLSSKVVGHANGNAGAALVDGDQGADTRTQLLLHRVNLAAQALGIEAVHDTAEELVAADLFRPGSVLLARATPHGQRLLRVGQLALELAGGLDQGSDPRRNFVGRRLETCRGFTQLQVAVAEPPPRGFAGQRLDPPHARADRAFRHDLQQLNVAQRADVGAAAQLDRIILVGRPSHREDADLVAIFLAEQRHRARGNGVIRGHQAGRYRLVRADMGVDVGLDGLDVLAAQRLGVREVEAEIVGRDEAALLRDMLAEPVAKRRVEQVRRAMVGADLVAAFGVDRLVDGIADRELALLDPGEQRMKLAERFRRVLDLAFEALETGQFSMITDLAAALSIERASG